MEDFGVIRLVSARHRRTRAEFQEMGKAESRKAQLSYIKPTPRHFFDLGVFQYKWVVSCWVFPLTPQKGSTLREPPRPLCAESLRGCGTEGHRGESYRPAGRRRWWGQDVHGLNWNNCNQGFGLPAIGAQWAPTSSEPKLQPG